MSLPQRLTAPMGKEAELYRALPGGKIQCTACARHCQIGEGQVGLCGIRGVVGGRLYLLVYGRIIAGHIDPIEKKPVVHYRPGSKVFSIATTGCSWLCHPAETRILMSDGTTKRIDHIETGDSLWSYDVELGFKIHPNIVTHTNERVARIWEIRYGGHAHGRLHLTEEHPVLTATGWKTPTEIRSGDTILRVWQSITTAWQEKHREILDHGLYLCRKCGEEISGYAEWNRHRGSCYTEGLEIQAEERYRRSARMKDRNPMSNPEVAGRAHASSKARFLTDDSHGWHRNVERLQSWLHAHPSTSQKVLYQILDELGIQYKREFRIRVEKPSPDSKQYYIADAAMLGPRLDIEVDGWWHYNNEGVKVSDRVRDETLDRNGWDVLRIPGSYLFNHPDAVKKLIVERLARPVMTNMRYWVKVHSVRPLHRIEKVYGIETIPDHNYVADGILVHNCRYCQNADISQRRKVEGTEVSPEEVVSQTISHGCEGIAYTYNQPTIFIEYARDVGVIARKKGLFNIFVSNGYDTPETVSAMDSFLDCVTVDFKGSGEREFVRKYIGIPDAEPIFGTLLDIKKRTKIHVEITDLIVPKAGDSLEAADRLCRWVYDNLGPDTPVHFLRFHPDYKMMDFPHTPVETLERHHAIGKKAGLNYVYIGNVPGHPAESTYCPGCGEVLIGRFGYEITAYNLDSNNRCVRCGHRTPIVGPLSKSFDDERFVSVIN